MNEEQIKKLKQLAATTHLSMAELIREAVNKFLLMQVLLDREELKKRAIAIAGAYHSKKKNLSKAHDQYLIEAYRK
ncbi:MAG: ribbon-helix-helix protein, CopG family [Deltaproteobacteria bacterium]|nr:ribbon-helix-helix protein, CopG family [Deltaproteobacteria bacterium]